MTIKKNEIRSNKRYSPLAILIRHFLWRFVSNDMTSFSPSSPSTLVSLGTILALTGAYLGYKIFSPFHSEIQSHFTWGIAYYFSLIMAFTGIIFVITWDRAFLEREDLVMLSPLPIPIKTLLLSKFFSSFLFVGIIAITFGFLVTPIATYFLTANTPIPSLFFALTFFTVLFAAIFFIFLLLALLQTLLIILVKTQWMLKVSIYLQAILIAGFIIVFALLPHFYEVQMDSNQESLSSFYWLPPIWFASLLTYISGFHDPFFASHAMMAIATLLLLLLIYAIAFYYSFRKLTTIPTGAEKPYQPGRLLKWCQLYFHAFLLRHPLERAIFYFSMQTLKRKRQYKIDLVVYLVIPLGFLLTRLLYLYSNQLADLYQIINEDTLSVQLVFSFFLALGFRQIILSPVQPTANWIFKVSETPKNRYYYYAGLKKAIWLLGPLPLYTLFFIFYLWSWGIEMAVYHTLYIYSLTIMLIELLFIHYQKVPFISVLTSGVHHLKTWWPVYLGGFIIYVWIFTRLEIFLLEQPVMLILFCGLIIGMVLLSRRLQRLSQREFFFIYDDEPETEMVSLELVR